MEHGSHEDVTATLSELERKLKELEQELETVGRGGETAVEPAQAGWQGAATPAAGADVSPPSEPGPPPPGTTPVAAEWHGGTQPPPQPEPTFHAAVPPPVPPSGPEPGPPPVQPPPTSHVTEWRTYAAPPPPAPLPADVVAPEMPPPGAAAAPAPPSPPSPAEASAPTAPAPAAAPAPSPAAPPAGERAAGTAGRLDELLRVREELVATADRLVAELQKVIEELGASAAEPEPEEPRILQSGRVAVDAEPFADLASLSAFEQALSQTPGVADVYVRSLDSGRARLEVELDHPTALADELRGCSPVPFEIVEATEVLVALRLEPT